MSAPHQKRAIKRPVFNPFPLHHSCTNRDVQPAPSNENDTFASIGQLAARIVGRVQKGCAK